MIEHAIPYLPHAMGALLLLFGVALASVSALERRREAAHAAIEAADRSRVGETTGDLAAAGSGVRGRHGDPYEDTANVDMFTFRLRLDLEDVEAELSAGLSRVVDAAGRALGVDISQISIRL